MINPLCASLRLALVAVTVVALGSLPARADLPSPGGTSRVGGTPRPGSDRPGERPMTIGELRLVLADLGVTLDRIVEVNSAFTSAQPPQQTFVERFGAIDDEQVKLWLESMPDPWNLQAVALRLRDKSLAAPGIAAGTPAAQPKGIVLVPQAPFTPAYPSGSSYNTFTATLSGLGYLTDSNGDGALNDERCDTSTADLIIAADALTFVAIAAQTACDAAPDILGEGTNTIPCIAAGVANVAVAAVQIPLQQCDYQDGNVDGAEIEAAYENTVRLLNKLACVNAAGPRRGAACNGVDDDCDQLIDECDEDAFPPDIMIDAAATVPWFRSVAEALAAVTAATHVLDDCSNAGITIPALSGTCGAVTTTVSATDSCGRTSSRSVVVRVDGTPPSVSINPSVESSCFATIAAAEAAVRAAASISDDCTPLASLDIRIDSTVSECKLRVRIEVKDLAGNRSTAAATVKVDPKPPVVHVDDAVSIPWFRNAAEATAAVARAVFATDECGAPTVSAPALSGSCGTVTASVTATDACGNATAATTNVRIDGAPPVITIPAAFANMCFADISAAEATIRAAATISDDCTPVNELNVKVTSTVTECTLRVQLEAIDLAGHRTVSAVTVSADTGRPLVEIELTWLGLRTEVLGFQTPPCFATTAAAEAAVLAATRFDDTCTPPDQITRTVASTGPSCARVVTVTGVDRCGNSGTDSVTVRVDPNVPATTCSVATSDLWPPNHEMVDVGFAFTATDDCTGTPKIDVRVTSDEPTSSADGAGQSSPSPDAEILRRLDGSIAGVRVRAERSESGDGRAYRIHVTATDACGNVSTSSSEVRVRPNASSAAVDSGQYYDATAVN